MMSKSDEELPRGSEAICPDWDSHVFKEVYYGYECEKCKLFYAFGCAPWEDCEDQP